MTRLTVPTRDPLRLDGFERAHKSRLLQIQILLAIALILAVMPSHWFAFSGDVRLDAQRVGYLLPVVVALLAVGVATRWGWEAARASGHCRVGSLLVGALAIVMCGDPLRKFFELLWLRHGWRPEELLHSPLRALPLVWIYAAGLALLAGYVAGVLAVLYSLCPKQLLERSPMLKRQLTRAAAIASVVPILHGILVLVGGVVLGPALLRSLGAIGIGAPARFAPFTEWVFYGGLARLAIVGVVQFALGIWAAVELARFVDIVTTTALPRPNPGRVSRYAWVALAVIAAVAVYSRGHLAFPISVHQPAHNFSHLFDLIRGRVPLHSYLVLLVAVTGLAAALTLVALFWGWVVDDTDTKEMLSEVVPKRFFTREQQEIAPALPIVAVFTAIVVFAFVGLAIESAFAPLRFVQDAGGFTGYWRAVDVLPHFGALDARHVISPGLFTLCGIGLLIMVFKSWRAFGFGVVVVGAGAAIVINRMDGIGALCLMFAVSMLVVAAVGKVVSMGRTEMQARVGEQAPDVTIVLGPLVLLLGIAIVFRLGDLPLALPLAAAVAFRFGWQAGTLNQDTEFQVERVTLSAALPLFLAGLVLAEHASGGLVRGGGFASVGQSVGIAFVGLPVLIALTTRRALTGAPAWRVDRILEG